MSKITKTIAALGVVAGLGVAALPLASYAADTENIQVTANVGSTISLSMAGNKNSVELDPVTNGAIDSDTVTAQVTTNDTTGYKLTASATTSTLSNTSGDTIVAGTPANNDTTSHWGIKWAGKAEDTYVGLGTTQTLKETNTENPSTADEVEITIAASASATQPTGEYTGSFTLTATANSEAGA